MEEARQYEETYGDARGDDEGEGDGDGLVRLDHVPGEG